ncbi:MAG: ABC-F family ATP-binding cassette domain-containing protein [Planctomycetota bacterium]
MASVSMQDVNKSYAGQMVLRGVTLDLHRGEKAGFIGANGSGKTTLFKLLTGIEAPDSGSITVSRGTTIGYLPQEPDLPTGATLLEAVETVFADHRILEARLEQLSHEMGEADDESRRESLMSEYDRLRAKFETGGGYAYEVRLREVLGGLGFDPDEYQKPVQVLSGGQKCRAALARLLLAECDMLLLDEPTNHLDIDATRWLENYLTAHKGGAVIISHDRYLLDRVVTKIIELENHAVSTYPTNYTNYAEAKRIRQLNASREYVKQQEWLTHQRDYIDRVRYAKDSAKQARGRQKYLDRMEADGKILEKPTGDRAKMALKFKANDRGGDMVIRCVNASKGYDGVTLIRDLNFEMTRGEKIGIIGPNGVGKTTLLRMLLRQTPADSGEVRLFENLTVGYYDQEHRDLDGSLSIIEAVRQVRPGVSEAEARSFLALFLFRKEEVFKRVGSLSGGEQSRVLLARLVWTNPQVLVLDEPTNHLDIPAREALEEALTLYPGSLLMVSHDRYFLDRVAVKLLVLPKRGEHEVIDGSWSAYSAIIAARETAQRIESEKLRDEARRAKEQKEPTPPKKKSRSKYAPQRISELEGRIIAHETRMKKLETLFADPAVLKDAARSKQLHEEYHGLKAELEDLNGQWEAAVEGQA